MAFVGVHAAKARFLRLSSSKLRAFHHGHLSGKRHFFIIRPFIIRSLLKIARVYQHICLERPTFALNALLHGLQPQVGLIVTDAHVLPFVLECL